MFIGSNRKIDKENILYIAGFQRNVNAYFLKKNPVAFYYLQQTKMENGNKNMNFQN